MPRGPRQKQASLPTSASITTTARIKRWHTKHRSKCILRLPEWHLWIWLMPSCQKANQRHDNKEKQGLLSFVSNMTTYRFETRTATKAEESMALASLKQHTRDAGGIVT